ncbi:hypothetical protein QQ045_017986 [Rhodiola kirilowii]
MASSNALVLATVLVTLILIYNSPKVEAQCGGNLIDAATKCLPFVKKEGRKTHPSKECCIALKPIDVTCLCKYLTSGYLGDISVEKALYVAQVCHVPVPHGKKCGGKSIMFYTEALNFLDLKGNFVLLIRLQYSPSCAMVSIPK